MSSNVSTGQVLGYVVGAVVGYFNPTIGVSLGANIGGVLGGLADPPKGPSTSSSGPRLSDLSQQTSTYGTVIPRIYGIDTVAGNVFWLENNQLKEVVKRTTQKSGGKGGGGGSATYTTYSYYATFAVGLCKGPIVGIRRLWIGSRLIYDAGNSTDFETIRASNNAANGFRIYLGTDTQLADPRMQATLGVANTPAYRGLSYIVFDDLALAKYSNSLLGATIKAEIIVDGSITNFPWVRGNMPFFGPNMAITWDGTQFLAFLQESNSTNYATSIDGVNWTLRKVPFGASPNVSVSVCTRSDGITLFFTGAQGGVARTENGHSWRHVPISTLNGVAYWGLICNDEWFLMYAREYNGRAYRSKDGKSWVATQDMVNTTSYPQGGKAANSKYFVLVKQGLQGVQVYDIKKGIWKVYPSPSFVNQTVGFSVAAWLQSLGVFVFGNIYNQITYTADFETWTQLPNVPNTIDSFYADANAVYTCANNGVVYYTYDVVTWNSFSVTPNGLDNIEAMVVVDGIIELLNFTSYTARVQKSKINSSTHVLSDIVSKECLKSDVLLAGDIDVTSLTDSVKGYKVSAKSSIRSCIEPLQASWPFDIVQSGYKIKFKRRGLTSSQTIQESSLGATLGESSRNLTVTREMDYMLPTRLSLTFCDIDREYDIGEQYAERLRLDNNNEIRIELPIVMSSSDAVQKAEILLYTYWLERQDISFTLPPSYLNIEPSDVITLVTTSATYQVRITNINYTSSGYVEITGKLNNSSTYTSTAVGENGVSSSGLIALPGSSSLLLADVPLLDSAMDNYGFLASAYGLKPNWPGASAIKSNDHQSWAAFQAFSTQPDIGFTTSTLGSGRTDVFDDVNFISVTGFSCVFDTSTDSNVLAGLNHFAIGDDTRWEIIGVRDCVLQGDGSYRFSRLLRGRCGTEWAVGTHATGDYVIALDDNSVKFAYSYGSEIGIERYFKTVTNGSLTEATSETAFTYRGLNLKCLAPINLGGYIAADDGIAHFYWTRRTRLGGEWRDNVEVSIGESTELYDLELYSDSGYTNLRKTIQVYNQYYDYSVASQTTDFGYQTQEIFFKVYQISERIGRGYVASGSIRSQDSDEYFNRVVLAMHMDGTNNSTTFTDLKGKVATRYGSTKISTDQSIFAGGSSAYFNGSTDYLTFPSSDDFDFGCGKYTIEFSIFRVTATQCRALMFGSNGSADSLQFYIAADGSGYFRPATGTNPAPGLGWPAGTIPVGSFVRVAMVWEAIDIQKLYVQGNLVSSASGYAWASIARTLSIGVDPSYTPLGFLNGYIDELRITKGVARYTSNYTVATKPFSNYFQYKAIPGGDPLWEYVIASLHMQDVNLTDSTWLTVAKSGNVTRSNTYSKFGGYSAYFDGANDRLAIPCDLSGSGDFTIEMFVLLKNGGHGANYSRIWHLGSGNNTGAMNLVSQLTLNPGKVFASIWTPTERVLGLSGLLSNDVFLHMCVERVSGVWTLYIEGVPIGSITDAMNLSQTTLYIGSNSSTGESFYGYIDEIRITKGAARYKGAFTPPAAAYLDF